MLLDVVDQTRSRLDAAVVLEHVHDHPRALVLVLQVRRVDQDQLVGLHGQVDVLLEDGRLVARVLVQADLADAQHVGLVEELGDHGDHLARQRDVLGLLGVDAQPGVVLDAEELRRRFGSTSVRWRK